MDNPSRVLGVLDRHLDHPVSLVFYQPVKKVGRLVLGRGEAVFGVARRLRILGICALLAP